MSDQITILGTEDIFDSAARRIEEAISEPALDIGGIVEIILGLIEAFQKCREERDGQTNGEAIKAMAQSKRRVLVAHARRQVRKNGVRGIRNVRAASDKLVAEIASATPEEINEIVASSGI